MGLMAAISPSALFRKLAQRARIIAASRDFFTGQGYLEVDTPVRIPAPAPETHIDAEPAGDWYLQTSPELCMKRMLADGFPRIYQICKCFRTGERGRRHLPEMTMLEWYTAGEDYTHMMAQCEALVPHIVASLGLPLDLSYQGRTIDLRPPWPRMSVEDAFRTWGGCSATAALDSGRVDEIMGLVIEPQLGWPRPVILYDYPAACGALARLKPGRPDLAERFELYIAGIELCNAFTELTDPVEQRQRFAIESEQRRAAGKAVYPAPERFLRDLERMPAATGNALGVDRLVMLLTDSDRIDDVVAFVPETL